MEKIFKTLDEQISILQGKGLIIPDEEYAKEILLRENYFFLSGYRHLFLSENGRSFLPGTTFNELYSLFYFDRHIRNILFRNLLIIENNIKSIMAYHLSMKYGIREEQYLNPKNFVKDADRKRQVNDLLKKLKRQIRINGGQHQATQHYIEHYGYIPLWIVVKILSFGIVGEFYSILKAEDQRAVAEFFRAKAENLLIWLPILANYRNLCAHEDILYEHKAQRPIMDSHFHQQLEIPRVDGEYIYGKDDLFALIIILKRMLRADDFYLMMENLDYEINLLAGKLKTIKIDKVLDRMGFPTNYKEIVRL
ncbi:MAG: Abi family protein [Bacilli bacterium]|nr:Abi family protein [Bacilli bacterium]